MPEQLPLLDTSVRSAQSASRSAGGIIYQIRYATMRALDMAPGQVLGIEYLDDVSLVGPDHRAWLMQVKNETAPLTNMSRGLWKTLAYWSKNLSTHSAPNLQLLFVTTAQVRGEFPLMLQQETTAEARKKLFDQVIKTSEDANVQGWIEQVRSLSSAQITVLLGKVRVVQEGDAEKLLHQIRSALRRTFRDESIGPTAERIEGWVLQRAHEAFRADRGVQIREEDVRNALQNWRDKEIPARLVVRHRRTSVNLEHERALYAKRTFFCQLEAIDWPSGGLDMALEDYLRNKRERADWDRNQEVMQEEIDGYEAELFERWRAEFLDPAGRRQSVPEKKNGQELCDAVMRSPSPPLCGEMSPPAHVFRGTCHELADRPAIGWHPRWESMFAAGSGAVRGDAVK